MPWALKPIQIEGRKVSVRTYTCDDIAEITAAIPDPTGWFGSALGINTPEKITAMLESNLNAYSQGVCHPLVYWVGDEVAGISRFLRIQASQKCIEIGGTWIAPKWKKTFVNTEVKFLLMQYCFETLDAERVEFRVNSENTESQRAVLRIGAKLEGRLRSCQIYPDNRIQDGYLFSVVRSEWVSVKTKLLALIENPGQKANDHTSFPERVETDRLVLRRFAATDAQSVYNLVHRNHADLIEGFPNTVKSLETLSQTDAYIIEKNHQWITRTLFCYGVFSKSDASQIGQIQIRNINWEIPSAELSYFIDSAYRRQGLGRELLKAIVHHTVSEKGFKRVYLRILPANLASTRLAEILGFDREGLHRREHKTGLGKLEDVVYFSKTAD